MRSNRLAMILLGLVSVLLAVLNAGNLPVFAASTGVEVVDNDTWGRRMSGLVRKSMEADDYMELGREQTDAPHREKFDPKAVSISPFMALGVEQAKQMMEEIKTFSPSDPSLQTVHKAVIDHWTILTSAMEQEVELYKTLSPTEGYKKYNVGIGQVRARYTVARKHAEARQIRWFDIFNKYCPSQTKLLPRYLYWMENPSKRTVLMGFRVVTFLDTPSVLYPQVDSPAEKAKLKTWDTIEQMDGTPVKTWDDFEAFLLPKKAGDTVKLVVRPDSGKPHTTELTLAGKKN